MKEKSKTKLRWVRWANHSSNACTRTTNLHAKRRPNGFEQEDASHLVQDSADCKRGQTKGAARKLSKSVEKLFDTF